MKQLLLGICLVAGHFAFSQQLSQSPDVVQEKGHIPAPPAFSNQFKAAPFWTEDFGNGFPAGWTVNDSSGICPWVYSTDGSWGYYNGNSGTAGSTPIASTSGANGFLICDPDSANNATYGQPSGTTYQYLSSYFTTSAINCSGRSSVILTFEQFFRYNNGVSLNVMVSNNGSTWTSYDVSNGQANNAASANADFVSVNITNVAANQPTVYIRIGWSARVYYWMIDDMALREAEPYDAMMGKSWWGSGQYQYQYYKIPMVQNSPITFYSEVSNNTGSQLDNVYSQATVSNGAQVFQGTSNQANLLPVEMDTFAVSTNWTPAATGSYDIDFTCGVSGQTDGDPSNNDVADSIEITASLYGVDNLTDPSQSTGSISNFSSNTGQPFRIGNIYEIINDDGVQCLEIGIANDPDNTGKSVYGEVHVWDDANQQWEQRGLTDVYDIQASDLGTIVSLPLFGEALVYAGEEALVLCGHYGGATSGADDVSFMYGQPVEGGTVYGFDGGGQAYYLANPRAIVCRAQFDCGLSVAENNLEQMKVYPNPATSEVSITLTAASGSTMVELIDAQGKQVLVENFKTASGAESTLTLNTSALSGGVYTLKVTSDQQTASERLVIF